MILNEESMELVNLVKEFVDNEVIPYAAEYEKRNEFPEEILDKALEALQTAVSEPTIFTVDAAKEG